MFRSLARRRRCFVCSHSAREPSVMDQRDKAARSGNCSDLPGPGCTTGINCAEGVQHQQKCHCGFNLLFIRWCLITNTLSRADECETGIIITQSRDARMLTPQITRQNTVAACDLASGQMRCKTEYRTMGGAPFCFIYLPNFRNNLFPVCWFTQKC